MVALTDEQVQQNGQVEEVGPYRILALLAVQLDIPSAEILLKKITSDAGIQTVACGFTLHDSGDVNCCWNPIRANVRKEGANGIL